MILFACFDQRLAQAAQINWRQVTRFARNLTYEIWQMILG